MVISDKSTTGANTYVQLIMNEFIDYMFKVPYRVIGIKDSVVIIDYSIEKVKYLHDVNELRNDA